MLSRRSWRSSLIGAHTEPVENRVEGCVGPAVIHLPSIRLKKGPAYSAGPFFHLLLGTLLCSSCLSKPNSNPTIDRYGRVLRKPSAKRWTEVPLDHAYRRTPHHTWSPSARNVALRARRARVMMAWAVFGVPPTGRISRCTEGPAVNRGHAPPHAGAALGTGRDAGWRCRCSSVRETLILDQSPRRSVGGSPVALTRSC